MLHTYWEVQHFKRIEHEREIEIAKKHLRGREYPSQYDTQRASYRKTSTEQWPVEVHNLLRKCWVLSSVFGPWLEEGYWVAQVIIEKSSKTGEGTRIQGMWGVAEKTGTVESGEK